MKVVGLLNLFDSPSLGNLTKTRTLASTSFLGRFTPIDFSLSNFANSGIDEINILIRDNFRSVAKHVGSIKSWVNNTKIGRQNLLLNEKGLFDGFFDEVQTTSFEYNLKTYPLSVLNKYESGWNVRFLKDNILPGTQIKFNLGYDYESGRITIPWYSPNGELLGVMGRLNFDGDSKYKYLPLIAFPKQFALYGLYQNKESIKESETVYIFESEKSVLQAHGYGYRNTVALGGNCIHSYQVCELLKLNVKKIILCFDEGLDLSIIKQSIKNIKECLVMRDVKIGILIDKENKYIKKGSKMSPTDQGKDIFENLLDECIIGGRK